MTAGIDFHTSNLLFALSVDIDSWTVQELYAALGGEPITVPFSQALGYHSIPVEVPTHPPKYLVCTPPVGKLWALCSGSAQSIRVIGFGESFSLPFSGQELPGTPQKFAAPELLLNLPSHLTEAIDIWALGNTVYELLCLGQLFCDLEHRPDFIGDLVVMLGGKEAMPESFWNACCELGVLKYLDKPWLDWDGRIKMGGGGALKKDVEEVMRRVLGVSTVIDPAHRAKAQAIVEMMPDAWETMEIISNDEDSIQPLSSDEDSIQAYSNDEEKTIQPLSNDEEETIQPHRNDSPSESRVCNAGGERE